MHLADTLSRAFLPTTENIQGEFGWEIGGDEKQHPWWWSATSVKRRDPDQLARGEGEAPSSTSSVLQFQRWDEHLWRSCFQRRMTLIPKQMRSTMKKFLHSSHVSVNGCLRRARVCMYWAGMTAKLKEYISQCETCSKYDTKQQRELLMSHEIAEHPWEKIGTDLYTIDGQDYLIVVDKFLGDWPPSQHKSEHCHKETEVPLCMTRKESQTL